MAFARNSVSNLYAGHFLTNLCNVSHELMTDDAGRCEAMLSPACPVKDVHIRTTDRSNLDLNKHVPEAYFGNGNFFVFHSLCMFCFNNSFHLKNPLS